MRLRVIAKLPAFQKKDLGSQLMMEVEERLLKLKKKDYYGSMSGSAIKNLAKFRL